MTDYDDFNFRETPTPGEVEKVYFKCTKCGKLILYIDRYQMERGTPPPTDPELVAAVLAGKIKFLNRKCDKCYAASYTVSAFAPPGTD